MSEAPEAVGCAELFNIYRYTMPEKKKAGLHGTAEIVTTTGGLNFRF